MELGSFRRCRGPLQGQGRHRPRQRCPDGESEDETRLPMHEDWNLLVNLHNVDFIYQ